jgi:hypothetical protein
VRVLQVAAEANRVGFVGRAKAAARARDRARDPQLDAAVGHLRELT